MKIKLDPRNKLHIAAGILKKINIHLQVDSLAHKATLSQIEELAVYGEQEAGQLRDVVESIDAFDQLVADNLNSMNVGERYNDIRQNFESIIKDLERKLKGAESEKVTPKWFERLQNSLSTWRRGSINDRYNKIKVISNAVFADTETQINHEKAIIDAYSNYREALRDSTTIALLIKEKVTADRDELKAELTKCLEALTAAQEAGSDTLTIAALQQQFDEVKKDYDYADRRQEIASSLEQKLTTTYGISEAIMTRYTQTSEVRERLQREAALHYSVNAGVMTTLMATYHQLESMNENTQSLMEMQDQTKRALETLTRHGGTANKVVQKAQEVTMRTVYNAEDIRKLYASTIEFRLSQERDYARLRKERDAAFVEVKKAIQEGQRKMSEVDVQIINDNFGTPATSERYKSRRASANTGAIEIEVPDVPTMNADRLKKKGSEVSDEAAKPARKRSGSAGP